MACDRCRRKATEVGPCGTPNFVKHSGGHLERFWEKFAGKGPHTNVMCKGGCCTSSGGVFASCS